jgi:pimeloyl-ACP methyl ester carboxylesterase
VWKRTLSAKSSIGEALDNRSSCFLGWAIRRTSSTASPSNSGSQLSRFRNYSPWLWSIERAPPEPANYSADRLGDDVVAVINALRLDCPILAGHSVAGEVLSAVGTRHPDKISAVTYIDAGYPYALYDQTHGDLILDSIALRNRLVELHVGTLPRAPQQIDDLLNEVQKVEGDLRQRKEDLAQLSKPNPIENPVSLAVLDGHCLLDPNRHRTVRTCERLSRRILGLYRLFQHPQATALVDG